MFSKPCEHGIKAIIYIASKSLEGKRVKIGDIVNNSGSPEAFTAKILGALTKYGIVNSHTGPRGGFEIDLRKLKQIMMSDVIKAIEGDSVYNGCALGLSECNKEHPCPMHDKFVTIRNDLKEMLTNTSVYDLALGLKNGKTVLMR